MKHIITDSEISKRAYELYLKRGGSAVENWFLAQSELKIEVELNENNKEKQEEHNRFLKNVFWSNK